MGCQPGDALKGVATRLEAIGGARLTSDAAKVGAGLPHSTKNER
jgi:hypothetical protein